MRVVTPSGRFSVRVIYVLTSSLRTPRNINHPFFLGNKA